MESANVHLSFPPSNSLFFQPFFSFNWRALNNILATKVNLFERKVSLTYMCELCEEELETCIHVLWNCSEAQLVWRMIPGLICLLEQQFVTWKDLVFWVVKHKQSSRGLYGTIEMQDGWGDKVMSHSTLIQWGMDLQQQFQAAKEGRSFE
jgi:hypothetical protein